MRKTAVLIATAVLAGAAAGPAAAAPVRLAATGDDPWVFVDRQGVTHVTWDVEDNLQTHTFYSRALPGARTFSAAVELPVAEGVDFAGTFVSQDPAPSNRLVLITERAPRVTGLPATYALTSADNGATWSAAVAVADPSPSVNPGGGRVNLVANGPAGIWLANGNPTLRMIKVPSALTPLVTNAQMVPITDKPYDGQVVFDAAGQPVFAFGALTQNFVRVGETGADIPAFATPGTGSIHLAAGPRGVIAMGAGGPTGSASIKIRRLVSGALTPEVRISAAGDQTFGQPYLSTDQTGRFHAVWRTGGTDLAYRVSENGSAWSPIRVIARANLGIYDPVVSAGADGKGWAVYSTGVDRAPIFAVQLDDPAEPDTTGIDNPVVSRRGGSVFVTPRNPSLAKLRKRKCVNVRVQSTKPATIRVAIFSGRRSIRVFGSTIVRFRKPGKRLVCVKVPLRARTFDVRQPFRFAFAVKDGANPRRNAPATTTTTGFTFFK